MEAKLKTIAEIISKSSKYELKKNNKTVFYCIKAEKK
jgi:hypothetical protein